MYFFFIPRTITISSEYRPCRSPQEATRMKYCLVKSPFHRERRKSFPSQAPVSPAHLPNAELKVTALQAYQVTRFVSHPVYFSAGALGKDERTV